MIPMLVEDFAKEWGCETEDQLSQFRVELQELGVIHELAGIARVYPDELRSALQQRRHNADEKNQGLSRIKRWFHDNACEMKRLRLEGKRAQGLYSVRSVRGGGREVGVKIQVVNYLQRGGWANFNLDMEVLRNADVEWIIMVVPAFAPGNTDFIQTRAQLYERANDSDYRDKASFSYRIKSNMADQYLDKYEQDLMSDIHGGYKAWQNARQFAAASD